MDTHVNERERVRKGYHGIARARTSKQAHLQRHIMRELGPVGPHYLVGGGGRGGKAEKSRHNNEGV